MKTVTLFLVTTLFTLFGCSAHNVVLPGSSSNSKYAPLNEKNRNGIIRYLNQGASFARKTRREDAYKQMHKNCNGKYVILNEGVKSEGGVIVPIGSNAIYSSNQYVYIEYKCIM